MIPKQTIELLATNEEWVKRIDQEGNFVEEPRIDSDNPIEIVRGDRERYSQATKVVVLPRLANFTISIDKEFEDRYLNYAGIMSTKPELWMFIPCSEDGKPLEKPSFNAAESISPVGQTRREEQILQYQQALSRVIFHGWEADSTQGHIMMGLNGIAHFEFVSDEEGVSCYDSAGRMVNNLEDLIIAEVQLMIKID